MKEVFISTFPSIIVAATSILVTIITLRSERKNNKQMIENINKNERKTRFDETKLQVYTELIDALESITIALKYYEDINIIGTDIDSLKHTLDRINQYFDNNTGKLFLFISEKSYSDIMKLRTSLYRESRGETFFDEGTDLKDSELFKLVAEAKRIEGQLKKELLQ